MADWTMLLCVLDDHIEKRGTADEVAAYLQHLLGLFGADLADPAGDPIASGIIDLRHRLQDLAVPGHLQRFTERMEELFAGYVAEARNRDRTQIPDVASYMRLREVTIGLKVMVSLAEFLEGSSLPDHLRNHPALQKLTTRASNIVGWANDLFTYEKEIIQGELHNLVLVLMNQRRLTITEAVAEAVALHDNEVRSFLGEVEQLPLLGVVGAGVERYVETLRCWIRGHLDWASETGRYRPFDPRAGEHRSRSASRSVAA
jgi:5-epi-alpha-selinene synthase